MALNKTLLAAQGPRCSEERGSGGNQAEVEGWGCPAFWGLRAHLENVNAASDSLQEIKPPKSHGMGGGGLQISRAEGKGTISFQNVNDKPARAVTVAKGKTFG